MKRHFQSLANSRPSVYAVEFMQKRVAISSWSRREPPDPDRDHTMNSTKGLELTRDDANSPTPSWPLVMVAPSPSSPPPFFSTSFHALCTSYLAWPLDARPLNRTCCQQQSSESSLDP